jgi:predicted Zn finger-like uncharacterized protein
LPSITDLLTRCPQCHTAFRASAAQLAARNGRVRCGTCQHAFDAYSAKVDIASPTTAASTSTDAAATTTPAPALPVAAATATEAQPNNLIADFPVDLLELDSPQGIEPTLGDSNADSFSAEPLSAPGNDDNEPSIEADGEPTAAPETVSHDDILLEPLAASETTAAEEEASATADAKPAAPPSHRTAWLFLFASLLLILLLLGQLSYRFRTELATVLPGAKDAFAAVNIDVPLPHQADMVSIEASDLQADAVRNLLILNATVKNRAPWSQSYPLLELTLTDTHDAVLLRRSLTPADYLPADSPPVFGPHADLAVRLWIDTHGATAAGYRLYVYYP